MSDPTLTTITVEMWKKMEADNARLRAALEPFAKLAQPLGGEAGRPSPIDVINRGGTDELRLSSPFGDPRQDVILFVEDFERARDALNTQKRGTAP